MIAVTRLLLLCIALAPLLGCAIGSRRPTRPNVLLIVADDLGYGELGCYGQQIIRTPNLDNLARRGVRFTNAYSGAPVCAPSRCALLTGRHTGHAAIRDNKELEPEGQEPLPGDAITLATILRESGYVTAAVGKWGLGPPGSSGDPHRHGFDSFFGYNCQRHAHNHCPPWLYHEDRAFALTGNLELPEYARRGQTLGPTYAPDLMLAEAQAFLREPRDTPWFLFYATALPHVALQAPDDALREYASLAPDPPYDGKRGYIPHPRPRAAYAAMISRLDRDIGALLDTVESMRQTRQTLVVFTSDNGPTSAGGVDPKFFNSAGRLRGLKGELYEGGIRVPLIVSQPGRVRRGIVSDAVCAAWDLLPTIARAAGVANEPAGLDGIDLTPALTGGRLAQRAALYWEYPSNGGWQAARLGKWKAVRRGLKSNPEAPIEVYDLLADPHESHDVAAAQPEIVRQAREIFSSRTPAQIPAWNF